jgi:tRNA threonylcarbamoyladenosine biosynthesis protein TsaE
MADLDVVEIADRQGMLEYGRMFAERLQSGDVVLLHGDLGAGKTTLTQGIAAGLNVLEDIQSPTFALVAEHSGFDSAGAPVRLYHLDLYRITRVEELEGLGYEQYIDPVDGISIVEWSDRAGGWTPEQFWLLQIAHNDSGGRTIRRSWRDSIS